eukprot:CAMPEP_0177411766 /NCGR_PEP_ID=MMETSP0368-20130122/65631_1 /TAXON_ID=447022 ORGANISM="Scrippsiella hangoei-like, Strain SHHI-4" /NCGR_SAMPLE_ID=MMETSP0368 /ASSEMBLY_ACC=CAM_ASM_000363 /LENGTH=48 /DNA_ID= /DNA_START= /DNA_END= /DNA_ORIENTATION=
MWWVDPKLKDYVSTFEVKHDDGGHPVSLRGIVRARGPQFVLVGTRADG